MKEPGFWNQRDLGGNPGSSTISSADLGKLNLSWVPTSSGKMESWHSLCRAVVRINETIYLKCQAPPGSQQMLTETTYG